MSNVALDFGQFNFGHNDPYEDKDDISKSNPLTGEPNGVEPEPNSADPTPDPEPNITIDINPANPVMEPNIDVNNSIDSADPASQDITKAYFEFAKKNNLVSVAEDFEFDGTEESLYQAQVQTIENNQRLALQAILDRFPDRLKAQAIYALRGGTDFNSFENTIENQLDDSSLIGQTQIVKKYYKELGWEDAKVEKYLSRLTEQDVAEEAVDAKQKLIAAEAKLRQDKINELKEEADQKAAKAQEFNNKVKTNIDQAGFIPQPRKQKLNNFVFNSIRKEDGAKTELMRAFDAIQSNPEHFIQLADLLLDYDPQKGIAFQRFEKKSNTTMAKGLKQALEETVSAKVASMNSSSQISQNGQAIDWSQFILN